MERLSGFHVDLGGKADLPAKLPSLAILHGERDAMVRIALRPVPILNGAWNEKSRFSILTISGVCCSPSYARRLLLVRYVELWRKLLARHPA